MNPTDVVATAQQAVLSSVDQTLSENGAAPSKGTASSTQISLEEACSIRNDDSSKGGPSSPKKGSRSNGTSKDDTADESSTGRKDNARDEGEISSSRPDKSAKQDDNNHGALEADDYMPEGDAGEMSFVIDTAGDMDVDREIAMDNESKTDKVETHVEAGLLLPSHVDVIPRADHPASKAGSSSAGPSQKASADNTSDNQGLEEDFEGDMGDFEQLDMDPSTANRYYGVEEKAERRAKEQCLGCGEFGHDRRHCPHQHCLACGAMDEHPTRFCPLSTSCFRCGGMGHQTRTCPKPRRGPRSEECERCGSYSHVKALCPTLWRVYTYSTSEDFDRHRAKAFFKLQHRKGARDPRKDLEPDPAELSDSEDEFTRAGEPEAPSGAGGSQFDPATRWCYNCSTAGNHWGDDCPEPRVNPTRDTGEPSAFSEFVSRLGPFAKLLPVAPPLAGFDMPPSQFTFNVGSGATMHVAGDIVPSPRGRNAANGANSSRHGQSIRDHRGGGGSSGAPLTIGKHILSSRSSSRTSSPASASAGPSSRSRGGNGERLVSFDRTKAIECEGGFLTRKEKKKGKVPLPEHLFRQWVRDRHDYPEHAEEIRAALEKRAELQSKGLGTKSVPSTRDIVGDLAGKRGSRRSTDTDSRPSKKRKGDSFNDPVVVESDDDDAADVYHNYGTFSDTDSGSDSDDNGSRRKKRRGDEKNNRRGRGQKDKAAPHTGWGYSGDSGSKGGGPKRGKFSRKNQEARSKPYERDTNGASSRNSGSGGKRRRGRGNGGGGGHGNGNGGNGGRGGGGGGSKSKQNGGGGGEKVRGGGSKYRGSYF
ncbi:uncharacterized protein UHOD_00725 [Ustilago sp. UG-2017b]|nr:uncharacterized protein UHOD_00725 [Ustilago sp. UG-2017b]